MGNSSDRQKRIAKKKRQRDRSRSQKRQAKRKSTSAQRQTMNEKVASYDIYLRDGRPSNQQYHAYWHVWMRNKRVGRAWLTKNPASEEEPGIYITVEINKTEQGKGIGQIVFRRAAELSNELVIYGVTRKSNVASVMAMQRAGYSLAATTKSGEGCYKWDRSSIARAFPTDVAHLSEDVDLSDHKVAEQQSLVTLSLREDHGVGTDRGAASATASLLETDSSAISQYRLLHHAGGRTVLFSMVHSWALFGASYHAWRTGRVPSQVVHIDDHTDLGACFLDDSVNPPTGRGGAPYILDEPGTIIENLLRASFNKGSYLTAFLALADVRGIQHVSWSGRATDAFVSTDRVSEKVLCVKYVDAGTTKFRLGVDIEPLDDPDEPVWLDIDLDAFCNRFNGDSDRRDLRASASEKRQVTERLDEAIGLIRGCERVKSAELVTIAVSPGFCPSDYWEEASRRMLEAVESLWTPF